MKRNSDIIVIIISVLALIGISAFLIYSPKEPKPRTISHQEEDSAVIEADNILKIMKPTFRFYKHDVDLVSLKYFWDWPSHKYDCPEKKEDLLKLSHNASETDSIYKVTCYFKSVSDTNYFTKEKRTETSNFINVFVDDQYRVMLLDCDSGLVYRKY